MRSDVDGANKDGVSRWASVNAEKAKKRECRKKERAFRGRVSASERVTFLR